MRLSLISLSVGIFLGGLPVSAATAVDVDVADAAGCALFDNGEVYCFGVMPGHEREMPFVAEKVPGLPTATRIAVGRFGACAIDRFGTLWCWGLDYQRSERAHEPILSCEPFRVEGLPPVRSVDMGYNHYCAISRSDEAWCWGMNPRGAVGCGHTDPVSEPTRVPYSRGAQSISAGVNNTCATFSDGRLACWGTDNPTRPGHPFIYDSPDPLLLREEYFGRMTMVSNGRNFACGIRDSGEVTCWGSNIMGQLGTGDPRLSDGPAGIGEVDGITSATDLDADYFNACAVQAGQVICWGVTLFDTGDDLGSQPPEAVPGLDGATKVSLGPAFGCAVVKGEVKCWGRAEHEGKPLIEGMSPTTPVSVPGMP